MAQGRVGRPEVMRVASSDGSGGRLLRSSRDAGVVMATDPRLVDAGYAKKLLADLPDIRRTRSEAEATEVLRDVLARLI